MDIWAGLRFSDCFWLVNQVQKSGINSVSILSPRTGIMSVSEPEKISVCKTGKLSGFKPGKIAVLKPGKIAVLKPGKMSVLKPGKILGLKLKLYFWFETDRYKPGIIPGWNGKDIIPGVL